MRLHFLPIALFATLLGACSADAPPPVAATPVADPAASNTPASKPEASLPEPGETSDVPGPSNPDGDDDLASFSGYGDVKFGIAAADMAKAWGGELKEEGKGDNVSCYFMTPAWVKNSAEFNFMIGDGKFVRFGTESSRFLAPGGGKVGMSKAEIIALYSGRIEEQPHKYSDGQYLRIKDSGGGNAVLIFETSAKGDAAKVTEWRVGTPPQVDYVEGCS